MKASWAWLGRFFAGGALADLDPEEVAGRLTMQGVAVDDVRPAFPAFEGVVVGRVLEVAPHPDADALSLCTVTAGDGERRVVCGAPNVEVGALYGFARPGARLPGDRRIGRAEIRGVTSEGMLCSAPELGLDALGSAEGIWEIPGATEADLGRDLREALGLDDVLLDLDVTSNRGDLLSHLGIAREIGWIAARPAAPPPFDLVEEGAPADGRAGVTIEDAEGCPLYLARLVENVTVGPSPAWLQARLLAFGMRPVNNVVDATNLVMLELGQPLHAFDFDRLEGGRIVVRAAREGEAFTTLDHVARTLAVGMTMICDAARPVAVGGVMGGLESEVGAGTTSVLLESAHFDPARVSRTARRLGIASEAATRFARGVDPRMAGPALDRVAALVADVAGGRVAPGRIGDGAPPGRDPAAVTLGVARLARLVGMSIPAARAETALRAIGFETEADDERIVARVPSWRFDVAREADLVEEVARLVGYETIPEAVLPAPPIAPAASPEERGAARVVAAARGAGFDEARTTSFVGARALGPRTPIDTLVEIRNPISKADHFLRPAILSTLGGAAAYNLKRGAARVRLFEIGHAFAREGPTVVETRRLGLVAAGHREPPHWSRVDPAPYDVFDLKGDVEDVLRRSAGAALETEAGGLEWLHPGRQAVVLVDGRAIGFLGEVHPAVTAAWGVDERIFAAELDLDPLVAPRAPARFRPFPEEPAVERDVALVVPDDVPGARVVRAVEGLELAWLARIHVFDRYSGRQIPEGHHSLGLRLTFQAGRTLTDDEVDAEVERLVERLDRDHGWQRR